MSDANQLAYDFMTALSSSDTARYEAVLGEEVGLRLHRWDGREVYRPRTRVMARLMDEWSSWPDPTLEVFDVLPHGDRVAVEFRIQATENQRYVGACSCGVVSLTWAARRPCRNFAASTSTRRSCACGWKKPGHAVISSP